MHWDSCTVASLDGRFRRKRNWGRCANMLQSWTLGVDRKVIMLTGKQVNSKMIYCYSPGKTGRSTYRVICLLKVQTKTCIYCMVIAVFSTKKTFLGFSSETRLSDKRYFQQLDNMYIKQSSSATLISLYIFDFRNPGLEMWHVPDMHKYSVNNDHNMTTYCTYI